MNERTIIADLQRRLASAEASLSEKADIVARKRAEDALRDSEARHLELFERMAEGFAELEAVRDDEGNLKDFRHLARNPASARVTGLLDEQVLGRLVGEVLPPEDARYWIDAYSQVFVSGKPSHYENFIPALDRWFAINVTPFGRSGVGVFYEDITERKRAEAALRQSEERQAFLLTLGDAMRAQTSANGLIEAAARLIGERLGASRIMFAEFDEARGIADIFFGWFADGAKPFPTVMRLEEYEGPILSDLRAGRVVRIDDTCDPALARPDLTAIAELGVMALISVPLLVSDRLLVNVSVHQDTARSWTDDEVALVQEVSERLWADLVRARAEAALRRSEERQAFLLKLSDALRPLAEAEEIQATTTRLLGAHLGVDRAMYGEVTGEPGAETGVIRGQFVRRAAEGRPAPAPFPDYFTFETFGAGVMARRYSGEGLAVADVNTDPDFAPTERVAWAGAGVQAAIVAPLIKGGRLVAELGVHSQTSRTWTDAEISLVREVGERTWAAAERARAEAALRKSEERFSQFAASSSDVLWIRDVETLELEFLSAAARDIYGVKPETLLGDPKPGIAMIVPDDRQDVFDNIARVRNGEAVVHDYRIQRADGAFRWMRSTGFPLVDAQGHVDKIGGISADFTERKLLAEHQAVLLAELQHRVRNIMALLRSITNRTGERAESVPEYRDLMMGRLLAFARVQALLTRAANVSVGVATIVRDEISVQAQHEGQYVLDGPDVALAPKAAEVLTLAIHELATNAVKYGALSAADGRVTVRWSTFEKRGGPWLAFDWTEEGAPARPQPPADASRRRGFGTELIEGRIPYELRGRGEVTIEPGGARCHLEFPLQEGASILDTGAPQRASVFGGAIDMTGEPDLTGRRVLVVEDDFYLATDAARALRGAGAEVMGPCATEEDARVQLDEQRPDVAVVDINLGPGPSFKLAEALKDRGIPFVFMTGYDAEVIPAEFAGVERLEKPLQLRQIVGAVAKLTIPA
ncbi:GAF domain-containing protein [Methylobacterium radiodurans]|uniref:Blue-light-activated histidine kinase n=1 Tax=Methylobacterium radiodurans TaxID=2202828 RepID=A0A2U8VR43_9HYPH|nr:GAF domain-containing protein [Methylobacterium radiodurans]AWN35686.1 hypothetical protein DK427_07970 [Methylobacterium radiodurans]